MRLVLPLALLALLAAAAPAQAHVESFSQAKTVTVGPYSVLLQPKPDVIFANTTLSMTAQIYLADTGSRARNVTATLAMEGPDGFTKTSEMRQDGTGYLVATVLLPARGNYTASVVVSNGDATYNATTTLEAYPDLAWRIRAADAEQDVYVNERASLVFEVVNRTTLRPASAFPDLKMMVEHWNEDHTLMLGAEEAAPVAAGNVLYLNHTFTKQGMYHLKFASPAGGFTYADVPILHLYATTRPGADFEEEGGDKIPAPALAALLAVLAAAAFVLRRRA